MNTLLLSMLTAIEIGLAVLTFSEGKEKKIWVRRRFFANIAEILAYILFSFFPGIDFSFRFKGLVIVIVIRIVVSGIVFLIKKKQEGDVSSLKIVSSAVLSLLILYFAASPSYIFEDYKGLNTSGSYEIKEANAILIDKSRVESFETDGSNREIPVDFYYPQTEDGEKFPLVVFSHGAFGYNRSNYSLYEELASNGYVVVSLSHPYHSFFCKDTDGKTITVNPAFMQSAFYVNEEGTKESEIFALSNEWINLRTMDMSFVIDTLKSCDNKGKFDDAWFFEGDESSIRQVLSETDFDKIAVIGHSLGGATAVNMGRIRDDISAVVNLDGSMLGEQLDLIDCEEYEFEGKKYNQKYVYYEEAYPVAILNIDNQEHHDSRVEAKKVGMPYANNAVMDNALDGYDTYFVNSGHMNFTDLPLFSAFLAKQLGTGTIDSKECVETMNHLVLSFFDDKLKEKGEFVVEESYGN